MEICVIGQGYIGLPTSILFAENGCNVVGVDINEDIVSKLNKGILSIEEEGLDVLLNQIVESGKYRADLTPDYADAYIISVPTPYVPGSFTCDLSYVISACESILPYIKKGNVIIIESTIAPLSMRNVVAPFFEKNGFSIGSDLYLAHCPERVLPGNIIYELVNNNRIVGGITDACVKKAAEVYRIFVKGNIVETTAEIAEMSKCMENTFRDVNIALANELMLICDKIGIDGLDVIKVANQHPRVNIHNPGPGVGGHCLAIDPYFIYSVAPDDANIIKLSRDINVSMPNFVVNKTKKLLDKFGNVNDKIIISIFGIAYKGNSDDDRESPAYPIINALKNDYEVRIFDPHVLEKSMDFNKCIENSSLILILTDHDEFKHLDYHKLIEKMNVPLIFDTKNVIEKYEVPNDIKLFNFGNIYLADENKF